MEGKDGAQCHTALLLRLTSDDNHVVPCPPQTSHRNRDISLGCISDISLAKLGVRGMQVGEYTMTNLP